MADIDKLINQWLDEDAENQKQQASDWWDDNRDND